MARRRRRTIGHNPLDEPVSATADVGLDDGPVRRGARLRRTESAGGTRAEAVEAPVEAPVAGKEGGSCWMWWVGAGVVALLILA
jgi:hypothetical protein